MSDKSPSNDIAAPLTTPDQSPRTVLEVELPPAGPGVSAFIDRMTAFFDHGQVDARAAHNIGVVIDEILTNLASHGRGPDQTVSVRITIDPRRVVGEIIDTGPAFDPRSTADPDVTAPLAERPVGGLGLFMVRKLTDTLDYVSRGGRNHTTFSVFRAVMPAQEGETSQRAVGSEAVTVLVVDDNPTTHKILSVVLVEEGYKLSQARDGAEAIALMRKSRPNIVVLDMTPTRTDGWAALGMIKSDPELAHIPVVMLTMVDEHNVGCSLGVSEFMTKPVDRTRLTGLIQRFACTRGEAVVLAVDHDPDLRTVIRQTIEDMGLTAAEAVNGRAALNWLNGNEPPALILLDVMTSEMDGFAVLERIRKNKASVGTPVVLLTAKSPAEEERVLLTRRSLQVLNKRPQPIESLGSVLAAVVKESALADRAAHD